MNRIEPYGLSSLDVFVVVVNEQSRFRFYSIAIEEDMIELRKWFPRFFNARYNYSFKPM